MAYLLLQMEDELENAPFFGFINCLFQLLFIPNL